MPNENDRRRTFTEYWNRTSAPALYNFYENNKWDPSTNNFVGGKSVSSSDPDQQQYNYPGGIGPEAFANFQNPEQAYADWQRQWAQQRELRNAPAWVQDALMNQYWQNYIQKMMSGQGSPFGPQTGSKTVAGPPMRQR